MQSGIIKPIEVPVHCMASRLRMMNIYLVNLPSPENASFSTGNMIDIVLGMILKKWVDKMIDAKVDHRNLTFNELIDHCANLES